MSLVVSGTMLNNLSVSVVRSTRTSVLARILLLVTVLNVLLSGGRHCSVCHAMPTPDEESFNREVSNNIPELKDSQSKMVSQ